MISVDDIFSAYANLIEYEKKLYEATENEIQALILFESVKFLVSQKNPGRSPKSDPEYQLRETELNRAQAEKRLAVHLHRVAKLEVQKYSDIVRLLEVDESGIDEVDSHPYDQADLVARNFRSRQKGEAVR